MGLPPQAVWDMALADLAEWVKQEGDSNLLAQMEAASG